MSRRATAPRTKSSTPSANQPAGPYATYEAGDRSVYDASGSAGDRSQSSAVQPGGEGPQAAGVDAPSPATLASRSGFAEAWDTAQNQITDNQLASALFTLSFWYDNPDLTADDHRNLTELLDQLAGTVIYSTQHTMEPPYAARRRETLFDIANEYKVPWRLLKKINAIRDPQVLVPGQELKVVRGPFRAEIDLARQEMTVFVDRYYAGRFVISTGNDPSPQPGSYEVLQKKYDQQSYYTADGEEVRSNDPMNPYGKYWIGLSKSLSIHGSPLQQSPYGTGCVSLSPRDAEDVFAILSRGSRVLIKESAGLSARPDTGLSRQ